MTDQAKKEEVQVQEVDHSRTFSDCVQQDVPSSNVSVAFTSIGILSGMVTISFVIAELWEGLILGLAVTFVSFVWAIANAERSKEPDALKVDPETDPKKSNEPIDLKAEVEKNLSDLKKLGQPLGGEYKNNKTEENNSRYKKLERLSETELPTHLETKYPKESAVTEVFFGCIGFLMALGLFEKGLWLFAFPVGLLALALFISAFSSAIKTDPTDEEKVRQKEKTKEEEKKNLLIYEKLNGLKLDNSPFGRDLRNVIKKYTSNSSYIFKIENCFKMTSNAYDRLKSELETPQKEEIFVSFSNRIYIGSQGIYDKKEGDGKFDSWDHIMGEYLKLYKKKASGDNVKQISKNDPMFESVPAVYLQFFSDVCDIFRRYDENAQKERMKAVKISDNRHDYRILNNDYRRDNSKERQYRKVHKNALLRLHDNRCVKCHDDENGLDLDHFVFSKNEGGCFMMEHKDGFLVNNAIPLCESCNRSKSDKSYLDFFSEEQLLEIFEKNVEMTKRLNDKHLEEAA